MWISVVVRLLLALALAACQGGGTGTEAVACTQIGCDSRVTFVFADLGLGGEAGAVDARMCFDDTCHETRFELRPDGSSTNANTALDVVAFERDLEISILLPDGEYDETTAHRISVQAAIEGGRRVSADREIHLERTQPNGAGCPPVCWQAREEIATPPAG